MPFPRASSTRPVSGPAGAPSTRRSRPPRHRPPRAPRPASSRASPSARSIARASRTGPRLVRSCRAIPASTRRVPGGNTPPRIRSRSSPAVASASEDRVIAGSARASIESLSGWLLTVDNGQPIVSRLKRQWVGSDGGGNQGKAGGGSTGQQSSAPELLRMERITKRFGDLVANDEVTFEVLPGEIHALLGENGAGKSTLMKILYGLQRPDSGQINLDRRLVTIRSPHEAVSLGIGMVHQKFMLVPNLTALENVVLGGSSPRPPPPA